MLDVLSSMPRLMSKTKTLKTWVSRRLRTKTQVSTLENHNPGTLCRKLQKEKRKEQHRRRVETGIVVGPTRKALKINTMKNSQCKITVAVDLSFDELMSEKVSLLLL